MDAGIVLYYAVLERRVSQGTRTTYTSYIRKIQVSWFGVVLLVKPKLFGYWESVPGTISGGRAGSLECELDVKTQSTFILRWIVSSLSYGDQ